MIKYLEFQWIESEDETVTIGLTEEGLDEFEEIREVRLPEPEEMVSKNTVCMELYTESGPLNIYSPVDGEILEVNKAVSEEPHLIQQDNYGDGWLIKIEAEEPVDEEEIAQMNREEL